MNSKNKKQRTQTKIESRKIVTRGERLWKYREVGKNVQILSYEMNKVRGSSVGGDVVKRKASCTVGENVN